MHYPPFDKFNQPTVFTKLIEKYSADIVVFGHLHGYVNCDLVSNINGVTYYFTSCDHIKNDPILLYE